ncbi:unnamed protein product [Adineta steineri]|uniref:Uncharacterized protein n=2 Tax=Adineta steineri TaxID=433720 RepID=A0A815RAY5_9BILA|nr:unnamed protein product [Adineta steineri]
MSIAFGRTLHYDELIKDDNTKLSSSEANNSQTIFNTLFGTGNGQNDTSSGYDSFQENKIHKRGISNPSPLSHTVSPQTRQALIDILEKALAEGWRPSNNHPNSATRRKILLVLVMIFLSMSITFGRALYYDELTEDDSTKLSSTEEDSLQTIFNKLYGNDNDQDHYSSEYNSFEERKFHERTILKPSQVSHTMSPETRQAMIEIIVKARAEGWQPRNNLYVSRTRLR